MNRILPHVPILLAAITVAIHAGAVLAFATGHATALLAAAWLVFGTLAPHVVACLYGLRLAYGIASIAAVTIPLTFVILFDFPLGAAISIAIPLGLLMAIWQLGIVYATQLIHHFIYQRWV